MVAWGVNDLSARRTTGEMEQESERSEVIYEAGKEYSKCVTAGLRREVVEILAFFGILRSVWWQFLTDASGQPIGPIFKGQA